MAAQLNASPEVVALLERLKAEHGELVLVLSHGCCDGTTPMCLPKGEWPARADEVVLGEVGGVQLRTGPDQAAQMAQLTLTLDLAPGNNGAFSLEDGTGQRLVLDRRVA